MNCGCFCVFIVIERRLRRRSWSSGCSEYEQCCGELVIDMLVEDALTYEVIHVACGSTSFADLVVT